MQVFYLLLRFPIQKGGKFKKWLFSGLKNCLLIVNEQLFFVLHGGDLGDFRKIAYCLLPSDIAY